GHGARVTAVAAITTCPVDIVGAQVAPDAGGAVTAVAAGADAAAGPAVTAAAVDTGRAEQATLGAVTTGTALAAVLTRTPVTAVAPGAVVDSGHTGCTGGTG